jgi:phosphopantetheinyl transferase
MVADPLLAINRSVVEETAEQIQYNFICSAIGRIKLMRFAQGSLQPPAISRQERGKPSVHTVGKYKFSEPKVIGVAARFVSANG